MDSSALTREIARMVDEREWSQFHSPQNLAKSIAVEAGELLECYQWSEDAEPDAVESELADVLTYCLLLADRLGHDPAEIVRRKLATTREKYPAEKARGRSTKYDRL
ncbi:MAG: nucleotide pyrophosphohydrolase [Nesterenkonia sp.]|uniref:nucleotide pyrophosphohydrolase n=1 Tax=Nesterenkonia marinintestina TaxID=2979865 RepID=UPI0021BF21D7|nr:nucleotide pyrophosphohydrolase [Nesterenkonia sp. GX14115]MDO5493039.1 nucleotide pyrophosphohydrolase [Nesterenkonia sp.]